MVASRVVVHGDVQGVFFRDACRHEAERVGVAGWVRNRGDGTVEAVFEGDADAVEQMCRWCESGPSHAQVERVDVSDQESTGLTGFEVRD
jgi:acylphosphatase